MGVGELEARKQSAVPVRFGEFRLDPARAEFTRSGEPVALRPKTYALLTLFVASPGRVLGKDELLAALWPKVVVTEGSLSQCVTELREALREHGASLIKTVARQGYRFDGELLADPTPAATPARDMPSIAVLPFQNLSGDPEQDYFADGMVEELITALSRMRSLFVIARSSSFTYKGRAVEAKQVGRELGVRYVLEGSVRKAGKRVRITVQLVDASMGAHIWADRFEGDLEEIFELQDRITASVVGAVAPKLQQAEIERAKRKLTGSLDAYDYYLRGLASFYQRNSHERIAEALRLFERAVELDSEFASARAMAALCYVDRKANGWMIDPVDEVSETERLARRAIQAGSDDAFVLGAGGWALAYVVRELDAGAGFVDRALALNPNLADAWRWGGWIKNWLGEPDVAIARLAHALRLNPLDQRCPSMHSAAAHAYFFAGRHDDAVSHASIFMQDQPDSQTAFRIHAASSAFAGRLMEAQQSVARLRELNPALRVSNLKNVLGPYRRPEDLAKYEEGLRLAGLPE